MILDGGACRCIAAHVECDDAGLGRGRQGDALQAYQQVRRTLADELGVEPGPPPGRQLAPRVRLYGGGRIRTFEGRATWFTATPL